MGGEEGATEEINLEYTPTWVVAAVCSVIVFISLLVERSLHFAGKFLKKKNQKSLFEALLKIKEELMLLGFISLLLVVFQGLIQRICIPVSLMDNMLPCSRPDAEKHASTTEHVGSAFFSAGSRRLLSGGSGDGYCKRKGKVPLLSLEALHQLHIFIFVLAVSHVTFSALTMILGTLQIHQWKVWEDEIQNDNSQAGPKKVIHLHQLDFIRERFKGIGKETFVYRWVHSFFKQFYGSVAKSDYTTMRLGFIMTHCRGNPKFNFHRYMMRALEADFKKVVGISWYLWVFVVIFLLLNINGWHTYFWIAFIPLILLLAVGTKLEHVVTKLAHDVAEKHVAIQGDLVIKPTDEHFWFHRPRLVLYLIHFILFQNAFEIAFFFWIWTTYGFDSCIMGQVGFIIPRLVIGLIIQVLCSYSTLPLYAIVTQMGSSFKKAIFEEHIHDGIVSWAKKAKMRKGRKAAAAQENSSNGKSDIEMQDAGEKRASQMAGEKRGPTDRKVGKLWNWIQEERHLQSTTS